MRLKKILLPLIFLFAASFAAAQSLPGGAQKVTSVEGITEYAFPNGLHVLLFPDQSQPKITVNVVYKVGSRNEAYGETGMAHLLEHMNFKTAKDGREIFKELTNNAAGFFNGTTDYDRTEYFESFNASDANLKWALELETDRMANMTMLKKDLETEMPVVRNEMEMGENDPSNILEERVLGAAYNFHNYGKSVIGARSDVERVPIDNLAAFYHKYYQPDNADLIIAGKFDTTKALELIAKTLGALPKPTRVLPVPYTVEPTQEGERSVILRRVADEQDVIAVYHIPAAMHPDTAAIEVLAEILGAKDTGRLYKALIDTHKAASVSMDARRMHDPGFAEVEAQLKPEQSADDAAQAITKTVEGVADNPPTQEEVDRAKARLIKNIDLAMTQSQRIALQLAEEIAAGDWRLYFLRRDDIAKVTPADVLRVAKDYFKSSNRTLGEFIPTKTPDRAVIAAAPDDATRFKDFKAGAAVSAGESFDPTPANIEKRIQRVTLPNGMHLVMFPKKTRGGVVYLDMNFRYGNEKSLFGKSTTADLMGDLLMHATKTKNRQQIQDETDKLEAQITLHAGAGNGSAKVRTVDANLPATINFLRELLREAEFPKSEFDLIQQQKIAEDESQKSDPMALVQNEFMRHLYAQFPKGDVRYVDTFDEDLAELKAATPEEISAYYNEFFAPAEGEIIVSGQFDPAGIQKLLTEQFGDWKSTKPYERITHPYAKVDAVNKNLETPDKQNALFFAGAAVKINDESPDFAALNMGGAVLGGSPNSRLFRRIRVKDGLSYGAGGGFAILTKDDGSFLNAYAIAAPQNMPHVESDFNEEVALLLKNGVTQADLDAARKTWLDQRTLQRSDEGQLADVLARNERWGRTMAWDAKIEDATRAVTPQQVLDALHKYLDPSTIFIYKGGDFKKAGVYQK